MNDFAMSCKECVFADWGEEDGLPTQTGCKLNVLDKDAIEATDNQSNFFLQNKVCLCMRTKNWLEKNPETNNLNQDDIMKVLNKEFEDIKMCDLLVYCVNHNYEDIMKTARSISNSNNKPRKITFIFDVKENRALQLLCDNEIRKLNLDFSREILLYPKTLRECADLLVHRVDVPYYMTLEAGNLYSEDVMIDLKNQSLTNFSPPIYIGNQNDMNNRVVNKNMHKFLGGNKNMDFVEKFIKTKEEVEEYHVKRNSINNSAQ